MSTVETLIASGELDRIEVDLPARNQLVRTFLGAKAFRDELPALLELPKKKYSQDTHMEQFYAIMVKYLSGQRMSVLPSWEDIKILSPVVDGIWEFRTLDIRMFGWFSAVDTFIAHRVLDKDFVQNHKLSTGLATATAYYRSTLGLDPPVFVASDRIQDVVSNQD